MTKRLRLLLVLVIDALFTLGFVYEAVRAQTLSDRLIAIACGFFFGGGGAFLVVNRSMNRRAWEAPSAPLRIEPDGTRHLDRLDLYASPKRAVSVLGASSLFVVAAAVIWLLGPPLMREVLAIASLCLAGVGIVSTVAILISHKPVISLDLDRLSYRTLRQPEVVVPYADVAAAYVVTIASQRLVCIAAVDLAAVFAATPDPRARKRLTRSVQWMNAPWVLPNTTRMAADDLVDLISEYVGAYHRSAGLSNSS